MFKNILPFELRNILTLFYFVSLFSIISLDYKHLSIILSKILFNFIVFKSNFMAALWRKLALRFLRNFGFLRNLKVFITKDLIV